MAVKGLLSVFVEIVAMFQSKIYLSPKEMHHSENAKILLNCGQPPDLQTD